MKKFLAMLLSAMMLASVCTGCAQNSAPEIIDDANAAAKAQVEEVKVSAGTDAPEAKYHWDFDSMDGLTPVTQVPKAADSANDGATFDIGAYDGETYIVDNGPVDKCLYLDGNYGVKLDVEALNTDEYSISFWVHATRLSTYGPTVQIGRNIGASDAGDKTVAWLNFTQSTWDGTIFPVVWNRNSSTGAFPWVYAADQSVHGLDEWVMITLVASGEKYTFADDGLERIGCKLYLDGQMVYDASADLGLYGGLAPEILTGDGIEAYIGVNYWDTMFRGFIDDMYIYDLALTDEQVAALYAKGDANAATEPPVEEIDPPAPEKVIIEITVDPDAMDTVGTPDVNNGWWTEWTKSFEVADYTKVTLKFNNYSDGALNWNNYVAVLANVATDGTVAPSAENYPGYAEYGVTRADNYGWGEYSAIYNADWSDWNAWLQSMMDAEVYLDIMRTGGKIVLQASISSWDGKTYESTATYNTDLGEDDPLHVFLTSDHCYLELLSVETSQLEKPEYITVVDYVKNEEKSAQYADAAEDDVASGAFWANFSDAYELEDQTALEFKFNNQSNGADPWNNYFIVFNSGDGTEYAVVRADWYGWGSGYSGAGVSEWDTTKEFTEFDNDMDVTLLVSRDGDAIVVDATMVNKADGSSIGTISNVVVQAGLNCFVSIGTDNAAVDMESVEVLDIVKTEVLVSSSDASDSDVPDSDVSDSDVSDSDVSDSDVSDSDVSDSDVSDSDVSDSDVSDSDVVYETVYVTSTDVVYPDAASDDLPVGTGWFAGFTQNYEVPSEGMTELKFNSSTAAPTTNYQTFAIILSEKGQGGGGTEYAVIRADRFGWSIDGSADGVANNSKLRNEGPEWDSCDIVWENWLETIKDMDVTMNLVRDGDTIAVNSTMEKADGTATYNTSVTLALNAALDCYVTVIADTAGIDMESVTVYEETQVAVSASDVSSTDA